LEQLSNSPKILLDILTPTPQQQKVLDLFTKMIAGGMILWEGHRQLREEFAKYKPNKKNNYYHQKK